jgi:hypothetical protein
MSCHNRTPAQFKKEDKSKTIAFYLCSGPAAVITVPVRMHGNYGTGFYPTGVIPYSV